MYLFGRVLWFHCIKTHKKAKNWLFCPLYFPPNRLLSPKFSRDTNRVPIRRNWVYSVDLTIVRFLKAEEYRLLQARSGPMFFRIKLKFPLIFRLSVSWMVVPRRHTCSSATPGRWHGPSSTDASTGRSVALQKKCDRNFSHSQKIPLRCLCTNMLRKAW